MDYKKYQQKQPFTDALQDGCSEMFCNIHRKTPMLASLLNKVIGLKDCSFIKKRLQYRCFMWILRNFLEQLFYKTPPMAVSVTKRIPFPLANFPINLQHLSVLLDSVNLKNTSKCNICDR